MQDNWLYVTLSPDGMTIDHTYCLEQVFRPDNDFPILEGLPLWLFKRPSCLLSWELLEGYFSSPYNLDKAFRKFIGLHYQPYVKPDTLDIEDSIKKIKYDRGTNPFK